MRNVAWGIRASEQSSHFLLPPWLRRRKSHSCCAVLSFLPKGECWQQDAGRGGGGRRGCPSYSKLSKIHQNSFPFAGSNFEQLLSTSDLRNCWKVRRIPPSKAHPPLIRKRKRGGGGGPPPPADISAYGEGGDGDTARTKMEEEETNGRKKSHPPHPLSSSS